MKNKYDKIVITWKGYPPNWVPLFTNEFIERHFIKDNVMDVQNIECAREQLIAIKNDLAK